MRKQKNHKHTMAVITGIIAIIAIALVIMQETQVINFGNKNTNPAGGTIAPGTGINDPTSTGTITRNNKVQLVTEKPEQKDWYQIKSAELDGETLRLEIRYDKSCAENIFSAYSTAGQGFMESYPVQTNVYLVHDARHDICVTDGVTQDQKVGSPARTQEGLTVTLEFSIQEIIDEHKKAYGTEGPITLNLKGFTNEQVMRLTYTP